MSTSKWNSIVETIESQLEHPRWKDVILGSKNILRLLQKEKGLPFPIMSHYSFRYDIARECGSIYITAIDERNCQICVLDWRMDICFFEKQIQIKDVVQELHHVLQTVPCKVETYFIAKYKNAKS